MMTRHITFKQEFLFNCVYECKYLIEMHWEEIALNKEVIKLNPDWEAYEELERLGKIKVFTARDEEDTLVGYFVVIVGTNLHYKDHLFASNDVIYLRPDHRRGFTGINLIKFAEKCLTDDGVSILTINTKKHYDFGKVLNRLGYSPIETVYSKKLKE